MFVLRVALDPDAVGGIADFDVPLQARLDGLLTQLEGIDRFESIHLAPDGRSALVPVVTAEDLDLPVVSVGDSLRDAVIVGLGDAPAHVEVYMAAPSPEACPVCNEVGTHDWSKHVVSADYAGGLIPL